MIRSIEFPVDPRWIKNPTNSPLATPGQRMGAAAQTRLCVETIALVLSEHFTRPGRHYVASDGFTLANVWTCKLTRISTGTVDPITGGASMKAVQDAVARWCEVPNERDPVWHWVEPIGQESKGFVKGADGKRRAWTGVRIELDDLAPGEPRRVQLATIEPFITRAKAAIKAREKAAKFTGAKAMPRVGKSMDRKATLRRMHGGTQVYHAAEGQQAASSAARSKAEVAFAKVTGKGGNPSEARFPKSEKTRETKGGRVVTAAGSEDATPRMLVDCPTCGAKRGIVCTTVGALVSGVHVERARLAGLASAAARVLAPTKPTGPRKVATTLTDEQAAMRAQARSVACPVCPAVNVAAVVPASGGECTDVPNNPEPFEYGVHAARARAAGLPAYPCAADLDAGARPVRIEVRCEACGGDGFAMGLDGARPCTCVLGKVTTGWTWLPGRGAEVWLVLPWLQPICPACLNRDECGKETCICCDRTGHSARGEGPTRIYSRAKDVPDPVPEVLRYRTPAEHVAAHGRTVTLRREVFTTRANRLAWMFRINGKRG